MRRVRKISLICMSVIQARVNQKVSTRTKLYRMPVLRKREKSKSVIVNACSSDESVSKIVHISVNTSKVKYSMNETKDEEPLVTDNSSINVPIYFKLFKCGNKF